MDFLQSTYEAAAESAQAGTAPRWSAPRARRARCGRREEFRIGHGARVKPACSKHRGAQRELRFANTL